MTLAEYYAKLGLPPESWHVGPEHPSLEELALALLARTERARILEVGVQSGGFAVPVILASVHRAGFSYTGIDSLDYTNAVPLRLIADFLAEHGVTGNVRFIESDSTAALRSLPGRSYDLILLDHYKPKYPTDLYEVCARDLLSADGVIVVHDVLSHAAAAWTHCERVCDAFGYEYTVDAQVFSGAGLVRRSTTKRGRAAAAWLVGLDVKARWHVHAAILASRRRVGHMLRAAGLRR